MAFTDRFGGSTITPARVAYRKLDLDAPLATEWPVYATADTALAYIMDVEPLQPNLTIALPDAREAGVGQDTLFLNSGALPYTVLSDDGTVIDTVSPGERKYYILVDNQTAGGSWVVTVFGAGVAQLDIANSAGPGLMAIGTTLGLARIVTDEAASRVIGASDRARVLVWGGGSGSLTLPLTSTYPRFELSFSNQGTGTLTINATGGETIDGSGSIDLSIGESAEVHAGTGEWVTVGRGRSTQFNFTQLQKTITGGTVTLTLTEASNVVQTYQGVLTSAAVVQLPEVVQVYYVSNKTSGPHSLTIRTTAAGGTTVTIPQGQNSILFSDGINVVNATTAAAVISGSVVFDTGSPAATPVGFGTTDTGFYSPGPGQIGASVQGTQVAQIDSAGLQLLGNTPALRIISAASAAFARVSAPAGVSKAIELATGSTLRWRLASDGTAETGANAGSNLILERYSDAGALVAPVLTVSRASGEVGVPVLTLGMDPITFNQAATKNYVDGVTPTLITTGHVVSVANLGQLLYTTSGSGVAVTLPSDATAAIRLGAVVPFMQRGVGAINFVADTGVTIEFEAGTGVNSRRYRALAAVKVASNVWSIQGGVQ